MQAIKDKKSSMSIRSVLKAGMLSTHAGKKAAKQKEAVSFSRAMLGSLPPAAIHGILTAVVSTSPEGLDCLIKAEMEAFGYVRESQSAHIQRSLDHRTEKLYQHKFCGGLMPKTAELKLPAPKGVEVEWAPGTTGRPKSAPKAKAS